MPISILTKDDFRAKGFPGAAEFFAKKTSLTSEQFEALSNVNRGRAFRIMEVAKARLIQRARNVIHRGIREGWSLGQTQRAIYKIFQRAGLKRGAAPFTRGYMATLIRQNVMTSFSIARKRTLDDPEITLAFPFRQYLSQRDAAVRPEHAALDQLVFAWDDAFWNHFTPPWDWNCRCTFVALTAGTVKRLRITVMTYSGGVIRPAAGRRRKGIKIKPHPKFGFPRDTQDAAKFDLSKLDAEIRKVVEESLAA